jgi:hypothetical protein
MRDTQTNILAATPISGLLAIATDTTKIYYGDGTTWHSSPFTDFATETALLAATPPNGTMAVAIDTGKTYYYTGGNWTGVGGNAIPTGTADPAVATSNDGDLFYRTDTKDAKLFDGTNWVLLAPSALNNLSDVDLTTAPKAKETLVYDATSHTFKAGKGGGVEVAEPAVADRYDGMLWHDGTRLWVWRTTPTAWIEC